MAARLPIDADVLGYWGFDEANETDLGVDESLYANDLVVTASPAVIPARVGNGRQFDGTTTVAAPADSTVFRSWLNGAVLCWIILDSVNQSGDQLRPVVCLDGPAADDPTLFGLFVSNEGRIVFRYTGLADADENNVNVHPVVVEYRTAPSVVRTSRYYAVFLNVAYDADGHALISLLVNNDPVAWETITSDGTPIAQGWQPAPVNNNVVLTVGGSQKTPSRWHGVVDELSIHRVTRPVEPYLRAAYFRLALAARFAKLTVHGNVRTLGAVEMGGGTRWWCYERDKSIYVIRENSLGLFSPEVLLTTAGTQANGAPNPGGVEQPVLAYDAASDALLVAFTGGGRVFKLTATSQDSPSTQNMGFTQDTATVLKATDATDQVVWMGGDHGKSNYNPGDTSVAASLDFIHDPSFGIAVTGTNGYGYRIVRFTPGGASAVIGEVSGAKQTARAVASGNYWHFPLNRAAQPFGCYFVAYPIRRDGSLSRNVSNAIYYIGYPSAELYTETRRIWNEWGEAFSEPGTVSAGEGPLRVPAQVNRGVLKQNVVPEEFTEGGGATGWRPAVAQVFRDPVKVGINESGALGGGARHDYPVTIQRTAGPRYPA